MVLRGWIFKGLYIFWQYFHGNLNFQKRAKGVILCQSMQNFDDSNTKSHFKVG